MLAFALLQVPKRPHNHRHTTPQTRKGVCALGNDDHDTRLNRIKANARGAIEDVEASENYIRDLRTLTGPVLGQLAEEKERLNKAYEFINSWASTSDAWTIAESMPFLEHLDVSMQITREDTRRQSDTWQRAQHNVIEAAVSTSMVSGSTFVTESLVLSVGEALSSVDNRIRTSLEVFQQPSVHRKRQRIKESLTAVDRLMSTKYEEAHSAFDEGRYMSAAHAMREVLSSLGHALGPDDQVVSAEWYKSEAGQTNPTQAQRIKYSIIGKRLHPALTPDVLNRVDELSGEARRIYKSLSQEAHRRERVWERESVRRYLATSDAILWQVFELRATLGQQ